MLDVRRFLLFYFLIPTFYFATGFPTTAISWLGKSNQRLSELTGDCGGAVTEESLELAPELRGAL